MSGIADYKPFKKVNCCSKCGSQDIARSHRRNPLEVALSVVVLPWRCRVCFSRFFRLRSFQAAPMATEERTSATKSASANA